MPRIVRIAWNVLAYVCFFGSSASTTYFIYLSRHSPAVPIASTGQAVELNNHGSLFYVRYWDGVLAESSFTLIPLLFVTAALLRWRYGKWPEANDFLGPGLVLGVLLVGCAIYMFLPFFLKQ